MNSCIMRTGKRVKNRIGNKGYSLVELIIVISIMTIMVGVMSYGIGMMFSKDANYVAVRIDDGLTEARTLAMSREGVFIYSLHIDSDTKKNCIKIYKVASEDDTPVDPPYKEIALDKSVKIDIKKKVDSTETDMTPSPSGSINVIFDKANGSVKKVDGSKGEGVYIFTVTSTRNSSKVKEVTLVSATGRHYTEK